MNDSLASQQKSKKTGGDVLSARLLYGQLSRSLSKR